jgi:BirA family biotin operon repressor/biotin-[acetyl-CoA-carboxylase] ligase
VVHRASTGSTNDDLAAMFRAGEGGRIAVVADHQSAGRGRRMRVWEAPAGMNLLMSVLIDPAPEPPHMAVWRAGLAIVSAAAQIPGAPPCTLKWPNDVVVARGHRDADAKVAGILSTLVTDDRRRRAVVVGCGINVGWAPEGGARLSPEGSDADHAAVVRSVRDGLLAAVDAVADDEVYAMYRAGLGTLGRRVRVTVGDGSNPDAAIEGRAVDVGVDGRLVVLDDCAVTHRIDVGDVIHLRLAT